MDKYEKMARELCRRKKEDPESMVHFGRNYSRIRPLWEFYADDFKSLDEKLGVMNDLGSNWTA